MNTEKNLKERILDFMRGAAYAPMTAEEVLSAMQRHDPVFMELIPLSLEEIFICETEVKGYDIKKLVL